MSLPTLLLLLGLACWCLGLLRAAIALMDGGAAQRDLQRLGLTGPLAVPLWCWLRMVLSLAGAMALLRLIESLSGLQPWWWLPGSLLGAWLGWRLPPLLLQPLARRREQRLARAVAALVERVAVALLCNLAAAPALRLALAHDQRTGLQRLLPPLLKPAGRRPRQRAAAIAALAARYAGAPPPLRGLARVLRRACGPQADAAEAERLKRTLTAWSHGYARGAYDWQLTPPEPRNHELAQHPTVEFDSS